MNTTESPCSHSKSSFSPAGIYLFKVSTRNLFKANNKDNNFYVSKIFDKQAPA